MRLGCQISLCGLKYSSFSSPYLQEKKVIPAGRATIFHVVNVTLDLRIIRTTIKRILDGPILGGWGWDFLYHFFFSFCSVQDCMPFLKPNCTLMLLMSLEGGNINNTDFNFARLLDTLIYQVDSQPNQVLFMPTT